MKIDDMSGRLCLPPDCRRILCAVSGGADSVCLLHLLHENREKLGIELCAAHFEHGIRGEESLRDAAFVRSECDKLGVALFEGRGDTPAYAREKGMGLEEAARSLRYAFFEAALEDSGCDAVATAHNADDNAETMVFNLVRGSGAKGLCGIPPRRGRIIRPLLNVTRAEIEEYLAGRGIACVTDSSNASDDYSRNLIRHRVMPVLREINPRLSTAMGRSAALLRQDEDCLSSMARAYIEENYSEGSLGCAPLLALHAALSSRVLRLLCPESLEEKHVAALTELARGSGLGYCDVPGLRVRREQGRLFFEPCEPAALPPREIRPGDVLELYGAGLRLSVTKCIYKGEIHGLFKTYWVKCESICGKLMCTSRMPGDRISPQGRNCTKSLKAIFTERKMTQRERELCPVIRDDAGVLILAGIAADKRCRPEKGDEALCLVFEKLE